MALDNTNDLLKVISRMESGNPPRILSKLLFNDMKNSERTKESHENDKSYVVLCSIPYLSFFFIICLFNYRLQVVCGNLIR